MDARRERRPRRLVLTVLLFILRRRNNCGSGYLCLVRLVCAVVVVGGGHLDITRSHIFEAGLVTHPRLLMS